MMKFSERHGFTPVRAALQIDSIDEGLRNRLWTLISKHFFYNLPSQRGVMSDFLPLQTEAHNTFKDIWHSYLKYPVDDIGTSYITAFQALKGYFLKCPWYDVYNLVEFLGGELKEPLRQKYISESNEILKEEMSGYRFISGCISPITGEQEIAAIEKALASPDSLRPVREHLKQALVHLSDRANPDYRNSIKESISAVEALSRIISGLSNATLGPALKAVDTTTKLHPSLKDGFLKIYGYTSNSDGIRHAMLDEPDLDLEDALFMLVSCSAFVNYLVVKANKAGIKL